MRKKGYVTLFTNSSLNMFVTNSNVNRVISIMRRQVHSCVAMCSSAKKEAKTFAKLMTVSYRKRKNWYSADMMAKIPVLPANKKFQEGGSSKRRVDVLNKLFMRSITDLLATGEVAPYLIGHGISITKVKVAADFSAVNVYWTAKGAIPNSEFDKNLEKAGFELRHHLCQLHIMGKVPKICFIADKWQKIMENTLHCLETVKIKDGLMSEDLAVKTKSECVLEVPLAREEQTKIEEFEHFTVDPLSPMTHNVLGLDYAAIMTKIERAVKKSEAKHRQSSVNDDHMITHVKDNVTEALVINYDSYPSNITKYIEKKKIEKKKANRALKKEFLAGLEMLERPKDEEYIDSEDSDFIEDFDVMKNGTELKEK